MRFVYFWFFLITVKNYGRDFKKFAMEMAEYVTAEQIPVSFGGTNVLELKNSVEEQMMMKHAVDVCKKHNVDMFDEFKLTSKMAL